MKLTVQKREITGKKVKHLRKDGLVPASVFGPGIKPENLVVKMLEFKKVFDKAGHNKFIDLEVEGNSNFKVLIKDVQIHPVKDYFISVSFYRIDENRKIAVEVPLEFIGTSKAEKAKLGFLVYQFDTINLHCLPKDLPDNIQVDISELENPGDAISASDIKLPANVDFDSSVGDPTKVALVYVATDQKELAVEEVTPVEGEEATPVEGAAVADANAEKGKAGGEKKE